MSHTSGNRARFFPAQTSQPADVPSAPASRTETICSPTFSMTTAGSDCNLSLVSFSQRNAHLDASRSSQSASDGSGDEIVAQRMRTTEVETLFKTKPKERNQKLNIAGLLKHKGSDAKSMEVSFPHATIREVSVHEELESRSPLQYADHKLISSSHSSNPSPDVSSYSLPPSSQVSSKTFSSVPSLRARSPARGSFNNSETSSAALSHPNSPHIATGISSDNKIKDLTTAFNRRRSTISKPAPPRFAGLEESVEKTGSHLDTLASRHRMEVRQEPQLEDDISADSYRMIGLSDAAEGEVRFHHNLNENRGEKRGSISDVEDSQAGAHAGKRPRIEAYNDILSQERPFPDPEVDTNRQVMPSDTKFSKDSATQDHTFTRDHQLRFFLGQDVDEYIFTHMETYEAAKTRWSECPRDEWEKGADELVEKFTRILDFVKDHVKRQVTLYTSLHTKIDDHLREREATAEMLKEAKRKLVTKTGVVVEEGSTGFHL